MKTVPLGLAAVAIAIAPISVVTAHATYKTGCAGLTGNAFVTCNACQLGSQAACAAMGTGGPANAPAPPPRPMPKPPPPMQIPTWCLPGEFCPGIN
jgi:hypothetical protein